MQRAVEVLCSGSAEISAAESLTPTSGTRLATFSTPFLAIGPPKVTTFGREKSAVGPHLHLSIETVILPKEAVAQIGAVCLLSSQVMQALAGQAVSDYKEGPSAIYSIGPGKKTVLTTARRGVFGKARVPTTVRGSSAILPKRQAPDGSLPAIAVNCVANDTATFATTAESSGISPAFMPLKGG